MCSYAYDVCIAKLNSKGAAAMSNLSINDMIGYQVESTADWRREKAKEFPDDARNLEAAKELDQLAAQIQALEGSEIHKQICELSDTLPDHFIEIETVSSELRSIGFHTGYTGAEFLEWYRDLLIECHEKVLDEQVEAPNLAEQVEQVPEVKAAREVYEAARAKAYAEARKKL
jgi:hypothetical protein